MHGEKPHVGQGKQLFTCWGCDRSVLGIRSFCKECGSISMKRISKTRGEEKSAGNWISILVRYLDDGYIIWAIKNHYWKRNKYPLIINLTKALISHMYTPIFAKHTWGYIHRPVYIYIHLHIPCINTICIQYILYNLLKYVLYIYIHIHCPYTIYTYTLYNIFLNKFYIFIDIYIVQYVYKVYNMYTMYYMQYTICIKSICIHYTYVYIIIDILYTLCKHVYILYIYITYTLYILYILYAYIFMYTHVHFYYIYICDCIYVINIWKSLFLEIYTV